MSPDTLIALPCIYILFGEKDSRRKVHLQEIGCSLHIIQFVKYRSPPDFLSHHLKVATSSYSLFFAGHKKQMGRLARQIRESCLPHTVAGSPTRAHAVILLHAETSASIDGQMGQAQ